MYYLNNKLLTISGILETYEKKTQDFRGDQYRAQLSLKNTLKSIYFPKLQSASAIFQALENRSFVSYPKLAELIKRFFFDDVLKLDDFYQASPDWIAEDADSFLQECSKKYGYPIESKPVLVAIYPRLVEALRLKFTLEDEDLNDEQAYEMAYKIIILCLDTENVSSQALFYEIAKIGEFLFQSFISNGENIIDGFKERYKLPPYESLAHFSFWLNFVKKYGYKALASFTWACEVEGLLTQRGWLIDEKTVEQAFLLLLYPRMESDPAFAKLCQQYHVSDFMYCSALEYMQRGWPRKQSDEVPSLVLETPLYRWQKLAPGDKRALILGKMTNSCQSLTDYADSCVKQALQFPANGIYVLVKKEKKLEKIIAQSYVWMSYAGNMCLDSFEYLPHRLNDAELKSILQGFAYALIQHFPSIKRVTLGVGGRSPHYLFPKVMIPEIIRYGAMYPDSYEQCCLASRPPKNTTAEHLRDYEAMVFSTPRQFREPMNYLKDHCGDLVVFNEELRALLSEHPDIVEILNPKNLIYLFVEPGYVPTLKDLYPFSEDEIGRISLARLMFHANPSILKKYWNRLSIEKRYHLAIASRILSSKGDSIIHSHAHDLTFLTEYFQDLDASQRMALIKLTNHHGECLVHLAAQKSEILEWVFTCFNPTEISEIFKIYNFSNQNLIFYVQDSLSLKRILSLYQGSYVNFLSVYDDKRNYLLEKILNKPELFTTMLDFINQEELYQLCFSSNTLTLKLMQYSYGFWRVLQNIPSNRLPQILSNHFSGAYILHQFCPHLDLLKWIVPQLSKFWLYRLAQTADNQCRTAFQIAAGRFDSLDYLLNQFSRSEQRKIVKLENRDFRKNLFCAAAKDQRSFKRILELYRPDELKNLLEERVSHRNSLIHLICDDVNLLCLYLAALPEQDRALVVERGTPAFNPFLLAERKPLVMLELLKHVPIELRYAKVNIPCRATSRLILQNLIEQPEFLCSLWSLFSPHDQALLLHGWNDESLLAKFLLNEKLLPIILDFLPKDQVFKHLKFELNKNHHQWISLVAQHRLLSIICSRLTLQEIQSLFRLEHHGESFLKKIAEQKSQFMYFVRDNLALWEIISENEYLYTQLAELLMHQDVFVYILENQGIEAILKIVHHPFVLNMEFAALKPLMLLFIDTLKADQIKSLLAADKSIFKHYLVMLSNDDEIWRHLTKDCDVLLAFLKIFPYEDMLRVLNYELDFGVNLYLYALMNRKIFHQFLASFTSSQRILLLQHAYATIYAPLRHQPEMVSILYQLEELRQKFEALLGSPHVKLEEQISYLMTVHMIDALRRGENLRTCWERLPSIRKEFEISRSFQPKQRFFSALNRIIEQGFHLMEDEATMKTFAESA